MLTGKEYKRLPTVCREIVDMDRTIATYTDRVVTPFAAKDRVTLRGLIKNRRALTLRAQDMWGKARSDDGAVRG